MVERKNIVLNGVENLSQRAVLTLESDGSVTNGRLRLYNFGAEPKGIISLGIYQDGKVAKAGLIKTSGMLYSFACDTPLSNNFSCAVINFVEGEPRPILYGNSEGYSDQDLIFGEVMKALSASKNITDVEDTLDKFGVDYDEKLKEEIDKVIDKTFEEEKISCAQDKCNHCESCEYKKFYLSNIKEEEQEDLLDLDAQNQMFYMELKPQLDDLFAKNPSEEYLTGLLPNSKWIKVKIDENGNYYVLGLINEEDKLKYICYGVPGVYQKNAPRELSGYPVWFPLDESKPQGFGYWLSYQDAESGESVKATIV